MKRRERDGKRCQSEKSDPIRASSEPTFDSDLISSLDGAETCTARSILEHASADNIRATFGSWDIRYFAIEVVFATWTRKRKELL